MTDPTGVCFLSYRRDRADDARLVLHALMDRGVPTWQDVSDLPRGVTETELKSVLDSDTTSSAVMLITPEVEHSPVIRDVEAPMILKRHNRGDGFFAVPVAAGGLGYADIARVIGPRAGLIDLSMFNVHKEDTDPLNGEAAARISRVALEERIAAICKATSKDEPLRIQISTRRPLPKEPGHALRVDICHRFTGRIALSGAWSEHILPAFADIVRVLQRKAPDRRIQLSGFLALPAAVALGTAFLSVNGVKASWLQEQETFGRDPEVWDLSVPPIASGFSAKEHPQSPSGVDYALLVSVTNDVTDDYSVSKIGLSLRSAVHVAPTEPREGRIQVGSGEATHIARLAVDSLRAAWTEHGKRGTIHLFLAAPAGLAFLIGQQLNTFAKVQTYEHVPGDPIPYKPAALLTPSI